jgi:hypothetical protein
MECQGDTTIVRWLDAWPGRLFPADTAVVLFGRPTILVSGVRPYAWDDDPRVEIRAIGPKKGQGYIWEARLAESGGWPRPIRFTALARADFPDAVTRECQ